MAFAPNVEFCFMIVTQSLHTFAVWYMPPTLPTVYILLLNILLWILQ